MWTPFPPLMQSLIGGTRDVDLEADLDAEILRVYKEVTELRS